MTGQKFSQDKLPLGTMILTQFPKALMEVARCTAAGNVKYKKFDEDWLNFSRVENPKFQYTNAALRHLMEAETHTFNEDMKEYDPKVRHLAQSAWNLLCRLEVELREEAEYINILEDATKIPPYKEKIKSWSQIKSEYEDMNPGVLQALRNYENKLWEEDMEILKRRDNPRLSINELLSSNKENEDYFPDSLV